MSSQTTNTILMIEPVAFGFNAETAENNYFQKQDQSPPKLIQDNALVEFNQMVLKLREKGINVLVTKDTKLPATPDSIFPNNWISFHNKECIALYPMYARNRRKERRADILELLKEQGYNFSDMKNYSDFEQSDIFLEGTGSMILDRENHIAYAAISERTNLELFTQFCLDFNFKPISFSANQDVEGLRLPIYHTNVMMSIANNYVIICLDSVDDILEKEMLVKNFQDCNKEIITITEEQMHNFAGNMLQVKNDNEQFFLVMSQTAYNSLSSHQVLQIEKYTNILPISIPTIEKYGGGSVRCMMAEVF